MRGKPRTDTRFLARLSSPTCIIYCRVSTEDQKDNGTSLASQERYCLEFAKRMGWRVLRVVKEDYSGNKLEERRLFAGVREDIRLGKANILLCYHPDRMSRNQTHALIIFEGICEAGAELHFVEGGKIEDSPIGRAMLMLFATGAAIQRHQITENSMRGRKERLLQGKIHNAGVPLYGYRINREASRREIYEPEAAVVRKIFDWCANEKLGAHGIALRLIELGFTSPSEGNKRKLKSGRAVWHKSAVWRILRNEAYMGVTVGWKRTTCGSKTRTATLRPANEHVKLPEGTSPPIVSEKIWQAAQKQLDSNAGAFVRNEKHPALLRGYVYCAYCERKMYPTTDKIKRYRCGSQGVPGVEPCQNKRIRADEVEQFAWQWVATILKDPDVISRAIEAMQKDVINPQWQLDLRIAKDALAKTKRSMEVLVGRMARADEFDTDIFERELAKLKKERIGLEGMIKELEQRIASSQKQVADLTELRDYAARERERIDGYTFEEKRRAIEQLDIRVVVKPERYRVDVPVQAYTDYTGIEESEAATKTRSASLLKPEWADTFADDLVAAGLLKPKSDVVVAPSWASRAPATTRAT
jgi:site-specific DNA recombinase